MALGQRSEADSTPTVLPDAPAQQTEQSGQAPAIVRPVQSGVSMFLMLQQKSLVFPDLATTEGPLSSWEKLKLAANNSVSLSTVGAAVIGSAYGQATNRPKGYGQGWDAYGQRLGADMARSASYQLFGTYALASVLHQDPRFYVKKDLNFGQSVAYSAERLIITRTDSGERAINSSGLLGTLASEGLASAYYPKGNNGVGDVFIRFGVDLGWRFGGHLLRQYWPELNKKLVVTPEKESTSP